MNLTAEVGNRLALGQSVTAVEVRFSGECRFRSIKAQMVAQHLSAVADFLDVSPDIEDPSLDASIDTYTYYLAGVLAEEEDKIRSRLSDDSDIAELKFTQVQARKGPAQDTRRQEKDDSSSVRKASTQTLRVEVEKINALGNLLGELVIGSDGIGSISEALQHAHSLEEARRFARDLKKAHQALRSVTSRLQERAMEIRMVPIGTVFNRFSRVVRDLAQENGKKMDLVISGEDTELDKIVTESLSDPILHLLRNAIDHGIESPAERIRAGKNPKGTIHLSAANEADTIVIKVSDDGAGLRLDRIAKKAVEKGLVTEAALKGLAQRDIVNFIYHAGFSTADKVSEVSGRGVGMDVVKTNIGKLSGTIETETSEGKGTSFTIRLPLTLSIIQVLLTQVGGEKVAIPVSNVRDIFRSMDTQVKSVQGNRVIQRDDGVVPTINLKKMLRLPCKNADEETNYIVEVQSVESRAGFSVDGLLGQHDVVIKSLGNYLGRIPGISGAAILGNGDIAIIVDTRGILERVGTKMAESGR